jgi:hypothetical protein
MSSFNEIINDESSSIALLDKLVCKSKRAIGNKIKNAILKRLTLINQDRKEKIDDILALLGCEVNNVHIGQYTCDGNVLDKKIGSVTRVILDKAILTNFQKTYPMEDLRLLLILKYITATEDHSIRYSAVVYIRFYRYLDWLKSKWNHNCNTIKDT